METIQNSVNPLQNYLKGLCLSTMQIERKRDGESEREAVAVLFVWLHCGSLWGCDTAGCWQTHSTAHRNSKEQELLYWWRHGKPCLTSSNKKPSLITLYHTQLWNSPIKISITHARTHTDSHQQQRCFIVICLIPLECVVWWYSDTLREQHTRFQLSTERK